MIRSRTFIFTISFIVASFFWGRAQNLVPERDENNKVDSISYQEKYGVRLGVDLSKAVRSFLDDDYTGIEVLGDYRYNKNFYIAAELGTEKKAFNLPYLMGKTKGSYLKAGVNYNTYDNWLGMQNELYVGGRVAFSTFSQNLEKYTIYTTDDYFDPDIRNINEDFSGLSASWLELQLGIKTQVLNNLYLSVHVELKRMFSQKEPDNFGNLYIPGFNRVYTDSSFGVGWGYSISYMIPLYTKKLSQKFIE